MKACPICEKGEFVKVKDIIMEVDGYVFVVQGHRCTECGEEFPFEEETRRVISASRRLGVWPEPMKLYRHISKSGRGLILRIPMDLEKQLHLKEGKEVAISKIGNHMIIETLDS